MEMIALNFPRMYDEPKTFKVIKINSINIPENMITIEFGDIGDFFSEVDGCLYELMGSDVVYSLGAVDDKGLIFCVTDFRKKSKAYEKEIEKNKPK